MAWLCRLGVVTNWSRFTPQFRKISDKMSGLGSDRGGMCIRLEGLDNTNNATSLEWYLTAYQNHGPEVPCSPALILVRKLLKNQISDRGAFPCFELITLSEFAAEIADFDISWEIRK
jgi:hypothetical protein